MSIYIFFLLLVSTDIAFSARVRSKAAALARAKVGAGAKLYWSSHGMGVHPAPVNAGRCYTVCPPVVYPWGHDPYYDSPYFIYEQELHGGPYGQGTMNPYGAGAPGRFTGPAGDAAHPIAGHWPGVRRPVVPRARPGAQPFSNPFPYNMDAIKPFEQYSFVEVKAKLEVAAKEQAEAFAKNRSKAEVKNQSKLETPGVHTNVHPPCYKVCPHTDAPNPDEESHGGPFGPDAYYGGTGKQMFNKNHMGNFRNPHMETYGGPFGPDPYFTYGDHQRSEALPRKTFGFPPK